MEIKHRERWLKSKGEKKQPSKKYNSEIQKKERKDLLRKKK